MELNYYLDRSSSWELKSQSEIEALRAMMLVHSESQHLDEFEVSVDDKIRVKRGIHSGQASGVMESIERKFTPEYLVEGTLCNDKAE